MCIYVYMYVYKYTCTNIFIHVQYNIDAEVEYVILWQYFSTHQPHLFYTKPDRYLLSQNYRMYLFRTPRTVTSSSPNSPLLDSHLTRPRLHLVACCCFHYRCLSCLLCMHRACVLLNGLYTNCHYAGIVVRIPPGHHTPVPRAILGYCPD